MPIKQTLFAFFRLISVFSSCQTRGADSEVKPGSVDPGRVLFVYLSRTNNTKAIAEIVHANMGTLVAWELENPYPENYKETVDQVVRENEEGFLPPLKTRIQNIEMFDIVFVGFPTWGLQLPPPMKSFLRQYNLSGKTIVPFNPGW